MTPPRDRMTERKAMITFAMAHGIAFEIRASPFMPGTLAYVVGEGKGRKIVHSPPRAWSALRAAIKPRPPSPRRPTATLRGDVMGIKIVK